ncbi:MAG: GntR family transcriptional regulator [Steroidobacteraceae bacterium]
MSSRTPARRRSKKPLRNKSTCVEDPVLFAVEEIVKVISSGRYAPGERLIEADFEREFGLGRVPVREALRILAGDGVVELVKNRGARIPVISRAHLVEMLQVQDALIRFALEEMVVHANYAMHMERLSEQARKMRERLQAKDHRGMLRAMIRYHELLIEASGNQYLKNVSRRHYLYHYERHIRDLTTLEQLERAVGPYEQATEALRQRDGARAYQCMRIKNYDLITALESESPPAMEDATSPSPPAAILKKTPRRKRTPAHA